MAQEIVTSHEKSGADVATEIYFDSHTRDIATRQNAYADRIFRWLDDENKDNNLLCVNILPSIINALPNDLKQHYVHNISDKTGGMYPTCIYIASPVNIEYLKASTNLLPNASRMLPGPSGLADNLSWIYIFVNIMSHITKYFQISLTSPITLPIIKIQTCIIQ